MRAVVQRVSKASVIVDNKVVGEIDKGIVVLLGLIDTDNGETFKYMSDKIINLRIFEYQTDKMNL